MSPEGGVTAVELIHVRVPFRRPMQTAAGLWSHRDSWIVRLFDGPFSHGTGEAALDSGAGEAAHAELERLALDSVRTVRGEIGPDYYAALDDAGAAGRAWRCAIDSALLDLGRIPRPGRSAAVTVNAVIGFGGPAETVRDVRTAVAAGFATLKLKAGPERDTADLVRRVSAVREIVGPEVRLRLDVNGAWDVVTARERLGALAQSGLEFVEQPVAPGDSAALAAVRAASPVPVAADESVGSVAAARELLAAGAADVLVVKPSRVGGPVAAWEIAAMAAVEGIPVVISTLFETGVGLAAAAVVAAGLPTVRERASDLAHGLATADLLDLDPMRNGPPVSRGRIDVPIGAGRISRYHAALTPFVVGSWGSRL
jgi:o-succinylbenzoate synthase